MKSLFSPRNIVIVLAVVGLVLLGYLATLGAGDKASFCDISEEISCSAVNTSIYSKVFGIPVAFGGIAYFFAVIFLALRSREDRKSWRRLFLLTVFALVPSLYLTATEIFLIGAICLLCELSKVVMVAVAVVAWRAAGGGGELRKQAVGVVIVGLLASGFMYLQQSGSLSANRDYTTLAQCLAEKNVVMYSSFTCQNCARQKKEMGDAFQYIDEVECHPRGENPQTERCSEKEIEGTPTWIQETEDGEVLKRLKKGYQSPSVLAEEFGCPLTAEGS